MQQTLMAHQPLHKAGTRSGAAVGIQAKQTPWEIEANLRAMIDAIPVPLVMSNGRGNTLHLNRAFMESTGYTLDDMPAMADWLSRVCPDPHDRQRVVQSWHDNLEKARLTGGAIAPMELDVKCRDGSVRTFMCCTAALEKSFAGICLTLLHDITSNKVAVDEFENLAFYDPLTYLPNRRFLLDRLHQALALSIRTGWHGALLLVDLDNFKGINDALGHSVGDLMLVETANRLQNCVQRGATIARLGADEFVVMIENLDEGEHAAAAHAEALGGKIHAALNLPYLFNGYEHFCTASIGVTLFHSSAKTLEETLKRADVALFQAKKAGRNMLRFFDPVIQAAIAARVALEADLRRAVSDQGQFLLYYQAQVDSSGHMIGAESLVRWLHPLRGMVSPAEFIPLAEESGLILPLGHWVLATACQQLADWAKRPATAHLTLAVNVSAKQFHLPTFVEEVLTLVDYFKINPAKLKLEITESMLLEHVDDIIAKMTELKIRGITFSMDDFGTGYSSLQYLKRLPLDQIKIDQSFVRDILVDDSGRAIVRTIIAMAQGMNLNVIAEGVETKAQRQFLLDKGCAHYQGFLFGRPMPVEQFEQLLILKNAICLEEAGDCEERRLMASSGLE